ncbi:hypothetical protein B0H14DRAFT_3460922 [Mycena olivaceomarginata]|nr:hypothetical protein B0H14DRAFT_3460922 [Mycena olivaceomarginata]
MTRVHANTHWQQICREQDARADAELHADRLCAADEERAIQAHERTKQLKLANEELACDLRAIDEEAEQRREYYAAADANFNRLQDELRHPSVPATPHYTAAHRKRHCPKRGRRQAAEREIVPNPEEEIVHDSEEEITTPDATDAGSDDNTKRESSAPHVKTQPHIPCIKSEGDTSCKSHAPRGGTERGPTRIEAEDGAGRIGCGTGAACGSYLPPIPPIGTEGGPVCVRCGADATCGSHRPLVRAGGGAACIGREAGTAFDFHAPHIVIEEGAAHIKRKAGAACTAFNSHVPHVAIEEGATCIKREAGATRTTFNSHVPHVTSQSRRGLLASSVRQALLTPGAKMSLAMHTMSMLGRLCMRLDPRRKGSITAGTPIKPKLSQVVSPRHSVHVRQASLPCHSDEELASPPSSYLPAARVGKPTPLFDSDEESPASVPAPKLSYVNSKRSELPLLHAIPALQSPPPGYSLATTPPAMTPLCAQGIGSPGPAATTPPAANPLNYKCPASTKAPLQVVVISDSSGEASTISRSVSSVSSLVLSTSSSSPSLSSAQFGKRKKFVVPTGPLMESASTAPGASSAPPVIFVNQQTQATYRSYKVAIEAMGEDECVVPMDAEEAVRMILRLEPDDGDNNWVDEDALASLSSTHRSHNPLAPLVHAQPKAKHICGPDTRATERKRRESKSQRGRALAQDLLKAQEDQEKVVEGLAETHGMHIKEVKRRMNSGSAFKQKRKTSAYNATVALVMEELNKDLPHGRKYLAKVVCQMMKEDPSLGQKYTAEEIEDKCAELEKKKLLRSMGVGATVKAAALDRHQSRGALKFFRDVFQRSPEDVLALLEMWAVTKNKDGEVVSTLAELQKSCGDMIRTGLQMITGKANIAMNFDN